MWAVIMVIVAYISVLYAIRYVCNMIIQKLVNKSMKKKMQKNSTFLEWFGYKRFRLEIPKYHIILNYVAFWFYLSLLLIVIVMVVFHIFPERTLNMVGICILGVSWILAIIYEIFFLGFHWAWTRLYHPERCDIRGIDKKKYMEARRK